MIAVQTEEQTAALWATGRMGIGAHGDLYRGRTLLLGGDAPDLRTDSETFAYFEASNAPAYRCLSTLWKMCCALNHYGVKVMVLLWKASRRKTNTEKRLNMR